LLKKVENKAKTVPQRLKPDCKCGTYGTAEAVPLSKTEYFNKLSGLLKFGVEFVGDLDVDHEEPR
jgi:hypothetical protein